MNNPQLLTQEKKDRPILIVDKGGIIGERIAQTISESLIVVFVSGSKDPRLKNVVHKPLGRNVPKIPDNYYSHIFLIDDGESFNKSISSFVSKAREDSSELILITGIRNFSQKTVDEVSSYQKGRVVYFGDLFSSETIFSSVGRIISDAKNLKKIEIEGEGLNHLYPIYLPDFVDFLIVKIFIEDKREKVLYIFPKDPTTTLGLARAIESIDPLIRIDFTGRKRKISAKNLEEIRGGLNRYNFKRPIREIFDRGYPTELKNQSLKKQKKEKTRIRRTIVFSLILLVFVVILPLFTTLAYAALGLFEIDRMKSNLERGNLSKALNSAKNSKTFFSFSQKTLVPLKAETKIIGLESDALAIEERVGVGKTLASASVDLLLAIEKIEKITQGDTRDPKKELSEAISLINNSIYEFRVVQTKKNLIPQIDSRMEQVSSVIDLASSALPTLPEILGFEKEVRYLLLFQNNMELRPGGGFIGSFGILSLKNARVTDFQIYDVYSADGQLKGHVEPPYPVRRHLPQPNFFLRDSNFEPDFTRNASRAANFLALETGIKVDGVIGVDVDFIKSILSSLGEVKVIDYDLSVNSENAFEIINEKSQKDFFPGSTQKKDFLTSLYKSIQGKIQKGNNISYLTFAKELTRLLSEKHIQLASSNPVVSDVLSVNNWSSQVSDSRRVEEGVFNDYLSVIEANLGIDKVNYHTSRSISKAQIIDEEGKLSSTVTVSYKNTSDSENYKNYIRFIIPEEARISQISFDNVAQRIIPAAKDPEIYERQGFKPEGLEVDEVYDYNKKIVGFLVEVPKNKIMSVSITYDLFGELSLTPKIDYSLKIFKQPGTSDIPFDFSLRYPEGYKVLDKVSEIKDEGNTATLNTNLKKDSDFNFSFSRK